jgi:hypothetical protein
MTTEKKANVEQTLDDLAGKAEDCSRLAKAQREGADKQQASADKQHDDARRLEQLGNALEDDVTEIKRALDDAKR